MATLVFCPSCSTEWNATNMVEKDSVDAENIAESRCPHSGREAQGVETVLRGSIYRHI